MSSTDVLAVVDATLRIERRASLRQSITSHAPDPGTNVVKPDRRLPSMHKLYRHNSLATDSARFEVQSLSDVLPAISASTSNIANRIQEGRRLRHDQALEDMKHELARISAEMEPRIHQASDHLKQQLAEENRVVEELMSKAGTKMCLENFTLGQLEDLWSSVAQRTPVRQKCLCTFEETLSRIESDRSSMVTDVISHYGSVLEASAYLLPEEVTKLMEDTAHTINLAFIANKKSYAALTKHLMIVELMKERDLRDQWEAIVGEWREVICSVVSNRFRSYMESDAVQNPPELQKTKALLKAEQTAVTRQREELLNQFSTMRPPSASKLAVYEWNEKVLRLQHQLEHVHNAYLVQLQLSSEDVVQQCQQEMERLKSYLIDVQACTGSSIYEVLNKHFVPLVEACSTSLREQLQAAERSLDLVLGTQQAHFNILFQYAQGAASLWDSHMAALDDIQRQYQDSLVKRRASHDLENQNLEANLDIVLDRLRQCPAKEVLTGYLQEAHRLLSMIKEGYSAFHNGMLREVPTLLPLTKEAIESYDSSLCKYLGVGRHPSKGKKGKGQAMKTSYASSSPHNTSKDSKRGGAKSGQSRASSVASVSPSPLASIVEEVISTTHGTSFYVQTLIEDVHLGPAVFLTQDEEAEGITGTFATEGLSISEEAFVHARNQLRASFLDHLEAWKFELTSKTEETVAGKVEEAHTELDIRMHLHEPRLGRVDDIGHTREAELTVHRDRILRHTNGVISAIDESKSLVESLSAKQDKLVGECSAELQKIEKSFYTADRLNSLQAMEEQLKDLTLKHAAMIKALGTTHLKTVQDVLSGLATSNDSFRASLKSFSEGGNYCHEEIETFARKMGKLSAKIEGVQASVSKEVLALTEVSQTQYQEAVGATKSHLQTHVMDISFLEAISSALANTQVKIKSEVAISNGQAQRLSQSVKQLQVLVDRCGTAPGLKKAEPSDLLAELPGVLDSFQARVDYLCCRAEPLHQGARAEVPKGGAESQPQGPISVVNVTRGIMEAVTTKKKVEPEADTPPSARHAKYSGSQTGLDIQPIVAPTDTPGHKMEATLHKSSHRKQAVALERKNISFGKDGGKDGTGSLLPKIRAILADVYAQLFQMAVIFYKQKGSRPVTRPDQLKETFETCMDHLIQRCQSYRTQAEEYRNDCIGELHEQLEQLMTILEQVPVVIFDALRKECQAKADKEQNVAMDTRLREIEESSKEGSLHVSRLTPTMGHPCQKQLLEQLCVTEQERHTKAIATIKNHGKTLKELVLTHANDFICILHVTTKNLMACFDSVTCPYEIVPGGNRSKPKQTIHQLIREGIQSYPANTEATDSVDVSLNTDTWLGLPITDLKALFEASSTNSDKLEAFAITEPLKSRKRTKAHDCVIKARDGMFQNYVALLTKLLQCISQDEQQELSKEEKRFNYWVQLVQKVKDLYNVPT